MIEKPTGKIELPPEIIAQIDIIYGVLGHIVDKLDSSNLPTNVKAESESQVSAACNTYILEDIIIPYTKSKFKLNEPIGPVNKKKFDYDVFICHSSADNESVSLIMDDFRTNNITYWVDAEQITFGKRITQKIEDGLKKSKWIMPCLSKNLSKSGWTRAEYGYFLNVELSGSATSRIIPIVLDNCDVDDIPPLLRDIRRVNRNSKEDYAQFLEYLMNVRL